MADGARGRAREAQRGPAARSTSASAQQRGLRRLGPRHPGLGRRLLGRVGVEVEQHRRDVDAGDAVDQAVVRLGDQREAVVTDAVDQPQLPQRLGAVEPLGEDAAREPAQLILAGGLRQRRVAHVVAGVEVRVVDPDRPALDERRERQLLAVARNEREPALELGDELLVGRRLALEQQHGADVHVRAALLEREERRV